ncbi:hypothetical protein [Streptomyces sp. NBC_00083]|uniref:hypothetical protein n=1 Tax=Streptomyces sp. NBC_00083 TaxID=2975647 RepID=UPI00225117F9|nr:hypothetical protein [Streptomyces sp. NBC_00083]MCX5381822.1 hypothetical protein [Streptomyces sp. NBC_00083]
MKASNKRGAAVIAALLCATVAACGTARPGDSPAADAAKPATATSTTPGAKCGGDRTDGTDGTAPDMGTDVDTDAGDPGPPTDVDTDAGNPGPPTDADAGDPGPPTDGDGGAGGPGAATDTGADAGSPGPATDGPARPCLPAGWFDMTQGFVDYYGQHLTKADDGMWPSVVAVRIRKQGGAEKAVVTVNFVPLGESDWQGRRVAEVFGDWRLNEYGDRGALRVETRSGGLITEQSW